MSFFFFSSDGRKFSLFFVLYWSKGVPQSEIVCWGLLLLKSLNFSILEGDVEGRSYVRV